MFPECFISKVILPKKEIMNKSEFHHFKVNDSLKGNNQWWLSFSLYFLHTLASHSKLAKNSLSDTHTLIHTITLLHNPHIHARTSTHKGIKNTYTHTLFKASFFLICLSSYVFSLSTSFHLSLSLI